MRTVGMTTTKFNSIKRQWYDTSIKLSLVRMALVTLRDMKGRKGSKFCLPPEFASIFL